jgi:hypothetical protein
MYMHAMACDGTFQKILIRKYSFPYESSVDAWLRGIFA